MAGGENKGQNIFDPNAYAFMLNNRINTLNQQLGYTKQQGVGPLAPKPILPGQPQVTSLPPQLSAPPTPIPTFGAAMPGSLPQGGAAVPAPSPYHGFGGMPGGMQSFQALLNSIRSRPSGVM